MSDAQTDHASVIEDLVPSFADLRAKVQSDMAEGRFWMIYFILLLPRLNKDDFGLLSTPEKLRSNKNPQEEDGSSLNVSDELGGIRERHGEDMMAKEEEIGAITNRSKRLEMESGEENEQWLEEADVPSETSPHIEGKTAGEVDVDVSFSDLEDEDNNDLPNQSSKHKSAQQAKGTSPTGSNDWVQLNEGSETRDASKRPSQSSSRDKDSEGESSDWLAVDDFD